MNVFCFFGVKFQPESVSSTAHLSLKCVILKSNLFLIPFYFEQHAHLYGIKMTKINRRFSTNLFRCNINSFGQSRFRILYDHVMPQFVMVQFRNAQKLTMPNMRPRAQKNIMHKHQILKQPKTLMAIPIK